MSSYKIGKNIVKLVETRNIDCNSGKMRWCVMYDYNNSPLFWGNHAECLKYLAGQDAIAE